MAEATKKGAGKAAEELSYEEFKQEVLADYKLACESREASLLGRKEVLTGKAKFGIFGDGKELAQIALAKTFKPGDFRSGYYRDQTLMFAIEQGNIQQFFAQLYAHTDLEADPHSAGRQMNAHFATRSLDENGMWRDIKNIKNSAADTSPTASQMARAVGLGLASKFYRENPELQNDNPFSNKGNEVVFATIGDASTSEGIFWESVNAAGVMRIPVAFVIWDDGYGISVPKKYQTTKGSISEVLSGFATNEEGDGIDIHTAKGWDYAQLCKTLQDGVAQMRETHRPAIFHITEVTQPQGHSTSGSHERYKSEERLQWEIDFDCIEKFKQFIIENGLATEEELDEIRKDSKNVARDSKKAAWDAFSATIKADLNDGLAHLAALAAESSQGQFIEAVHNDLKSALDPIRRDILKAIKKAIRLSRGEQGPARQAMIQWKQGLEERAKDMYNSYLYSESELSALKVPHVPAEYADEPEVLNGFEVLNRCFDNLIAKYPEIVAFGEDVGKIGDVNQGFAGLQEKHGEHRVFDTGIREATIMGQGIGLAMRGIRPIAEIQYLDYLIYGLQPLTDDLATLQYRTKGGQKAPMIIRTRGHRLEGIWHTGSPIGMILHSLRGVHVLVPRNMTQAAGFYHTLLQSDEPALVIECLNGYRLKEQVPSNFEDFNLPLGVPETLVEGTDVTLVTYGSCVRIAEEALQQLNEVGISVELIDVQSLLPFDINHQIVESLAKTNCVVFLDEDVPGGATAYMMQQVLETQGGYFHLDSQPICISAHPHRSAYGSDADYFCKPNAEDVFESIYNLMRETDPGRFPDLY